MKPVIYTAGVLLAAAAQLVHAQGMNMPMDKPMAKASASKPGGSALPMVNGEIRKLDAAKGTVVLQHEEIPNLGMPPMSMEFEVADKKMLKGVKAGDKVRFQSDMVKSKAVVTKLERSK